MALRFGLSALAAVVDGMRARREASRIMGMCIVLRCGEESWDRKSVGVDVEVFMVDLVMFCPCVTGKRVVCGK